MSAEPKADSIGAPCHITYRHINQNTGMFSDRPSTRGKLSESNTVKQFSVWTQTPAHRSTDNLESFLISRNYTEGLIVLCSPWKWNMLHRGLMVKDIACRSYIIERSWMSNQWEKMQQKQQYTSPQNLHSIVSTPFQPEREVNMCYVVYQCARRSFTLTGFVFQSVFPTNFKKFKFFRIRLWPQINYHTTLGQKE